MKNINTFYTYVACKIARQILHYTALYIEEHFGKIDAEDIPILKQFPKTIEEINKKHHDVWNVCDKYIDNSSDGEFAKILARLELHFSHLSHLATNYACMTTGTTKFICSDRWLHTNTRWSKWSKHPHYRCFRITGIEFKYIDFNEKYKNVE